MMIKRLEDPSVAKNAINPAGSSVSRTDYVSQEGSTVFEFDSAGILLDTYTRDENTIYKISGVGASTNAEI
jgi:hypothetical protein